MTHLELAALIETRNVADSKVEELIGKNVRSPSLVPGTLYIMKEWTIKHHINSDNPFSVVEFVGCGREDDGNRILQKDNFAIKEMKDGDYYFFKAVDAVKQETYMFGAYMFENCVCIKPGAIRVTCYAIKGHESEGFDATPKEKAPKVQREAKQQSHARSRVAAIDSDDAPVEEIDDDGNGSPFAVVCHPISMIPLRRQPKGFAGNV